MNNNDVLRSLRYAMDSSDIAIVQMAALGGYTVDKANIVGMMKNEEDADYLPCSNILLDAFLEGLLLLRDSIGKEERPLSWIIGPQGVHKMEKPSMRDLKQEERSKMGNIRPMNEI